ncbi:apoptosis-stimulating of p53 protein 1 [Elysia marginata]|uniref:Apoptosis-stimulating of p53 protein 1 n=1 Tax=Elysia marginata TaxID=1093978 RepID=A0AAV4GBJ8_9GAST|nr:apoptosis-stimulating of p53 protein 1 [Elysia marginata]
MLDGSRRNLADQMPGGSGDLTLGELQEMASRQQQQLEAQQQVLVAKEQRLKYLRQQEARHAQLASEGDRIRKMRERVESQELKLKKLRALRGQAQQYMANNGNLNGELDAVKAVFNEKEKELAMAVARVDRLNRQLQELRSGNSSNTTGGGGALDNKQAAVAAELEKLRKELLIRNKLNEQQSNTISAKEKMLNQRREEVARMDARIKELQQRLKKRQAQELQMKQQQQRQTQEQAKNSATSGTLKNDVGSNSSGKFGAPPGRSVATVEPYIQYAPQHIAKDDLYSKSLGGKFYKQDPKYQTLPARVKPMPRSGDGGGNSKPTKPVEMNNNSELIEEYQLPTVVPVRTSANTPGTGQVLDTASIGKDSRSGDPAYQNVNVAFPHQTPNLRPASKQQTSGGQGSAQTFFPNKPHLQSQHPAFLGAGDGTTHTKSTGPMPFNPIINIHEEERQAGSGQSSPASSEASNSSGGIQIKAESENEVNTASLGPVSAMIERLNRSGLTQQQHHQDRSVFTLRNGQATSQEGKLSTKSQQHIPPTSSSTNATGYGAGAQNLLQAQPPPEMPPTSSSSGFDDVDSSRRGNILQPAGVGRPPQIVSSSTTNTGSSAGPHLNQKPAPTYRYASKSQIASTYMPTRLGSAAMEKYQRNLNQIYRDLDANGGGGGGMNYSPTAAADGQSGDIQSGEARTSFSQSTTGGVDPSEMSTVDQAGHHPQFGVVSSPGYPDIASDKGSFKLNTPKQVRRRHSDSENEDLNRALQEHQELEQQDKQRQQQPQQQKNATSGKAAGDASGAVTQPSAKSELASTSNKSGSKPSVDGKKAWQSTDKSHETPATDKPPVDNGGSSTPAGSAKGKPDSQQSDPKPAKDSAGAEVSSSKTEPVVRRTKSNLKKDGNRRSTNRVSFDPLALLLDASLEGELDLVKKVAVQVDDVSTPNDEGITALHNAICAGHYEIVKVLVEFGCDVNSPDSDGWTPLHCAASCNNLPMVRFLVEHGACVFATTISDQETAADKCEEEEDGYDGCSDYLYSIQEKLGITNSGEVYGVFDYQATKTDELSFQIGDKLTVLRKGDETEKEWWWARLNGKEGYIPRNLLGLHPRVIPGPKEVSNC